MYNTGMSSRTRCMTRWCIHIYYLQCKITAAIYFHFSYPINHQYGSQCLEPVVTSHADYEHIMTAVVSLHAYIHWGFIVLFSSTFIVVAERVLLTFHTQIFFSLFSWFRNLKFESADVVRAELSHAGSYSQFPFPFHRKLQLCYLALK